MVPDILQSLDPRELGRRLQEARRTRGLTQQDAADHFGVARTTLTAIEKGQRRVQPQELTDLAKLYGRSVGEFLRKGPAVESFAVQLRSTLAPSADVETAIEPSTAEFQRLSEDYLELERLCGAPLARWYPVPYQVGHTPPEVVAEDVAGAERNRLGLGDGPLLNLRELLEGDVGMRIFLLDLPPRVAAMFAYTEDLGGCIAVNRNHPQERRRMSIAHDYGHFLTNRYQPEVAFIGRYQREPQHERFAEAFARSFLMPAPGLSRRFNALHETREGHPTVADLCTLADLYFVSVEALTRRIEELRLIPLGTWDELQIRGFRVREAQRLLGLAAHEPDEQSLPARYQYLALEAFQRGELSEGQFARFLRLDRLSARALAAELANRTDVSDEGRTDRAPLDFGHSAWPGDT